MIKFGVFIVSIVHAARPISDMGFYDLYVYVMSCIHVFNRLEAGTYAVNNLTTIPMVASSEHLHHLQEVFKAVCYFT